MASYKCTVCGYVHDGDGPPESCPVCGVGPELFELVAATPAPAARSAPNAGSSPARSDAAEIVVVGGGIAGLTLCEAARSAGAAGGLVLVHRENALPYDRMSLTRYLAGDVTREALALRSASTLHDLGIRTVCGEVRAIDREKKVLSFADGTTLGYERLGLATGAHAFVPPWPGVRRDGVHVLRTLTDADALLERCRVGASVVCIGGGLLGLETAGALRRRGANVHVLEEAPSLLHRQLAPSAALHLVRFFGSLGIVIETGTKATELVGDESVRAVKLADGRLLPADLVVIAAGVRPNIELARAANLRTARGIVVDETLRTSDASIYAAGDCAEQPGVMGGLWSVALEQARAAGSGLAGRPTALVPPVTSTQLKVLDWPVFSVGQFMPSADSDRVLERELETSFLRVVVAHDVIVGANVLGDTQWMGSLGKAVRERAHLSTLPELTKLLSS